VKTARAALALLWLAPGPPAHAEPVDDVAQLREVIRGLERRIAELEQGEAERVRDEVRAGVASVGAREHWSDRVRLGGSASLGYRDGGAGSAFDEGSASLSDARLFVDADLARDVGAGRQPLVRDIGFTLEWELVRLAALSNRPGEVYADLRGVFGQDWLNLQIGRFQLPFGEAYRLYSRGWSDRPLITNPVGAPWWWDEGVRIHGEFGEQRAGYVFAWSNGDSLFQTETDAEKAATLKLWARPFDWLELSASGHRSGRLGSDAGPAESAIWFGEAWIRGLGSGTSVDTWSHGAIVADPPAELDGVTALGGDAIWHWRDRMRGWLGYGGLSVDQRGDPTHDRRLRYWIAELVVQGGWLSRALTPFYAAVRANGLGTYDRDEGYLLDFRYAGSAGYNMRSLESYALGLGWRINDQLTLRAEYQLADIDLVRGVPASMRHAVDDADSLALELGLRF
jgi:hypothetical protein